MHTKKRMLTYLFLGLTAGAVCFGSAACSTEKQESPEPAQPQTIAAPKQANSEDKSKADVQEAPAVKAQPKTAQPKPALKSAQPKTVESKHVQHKSDEPKEEAQPNSQAPKFDRIARNDPPPPPPPPRTYTIEYGTRLNVITTESLSTKKNLNGDTFVATLAQPIADG